METTLNQLTQNTLIEQIHENFIELKTLKATRAYPTAKFIDINPYAWYQDAAEVVYSYGIMNGTSEMLFSPHDELTPQMLAGIIYNLSGQVELPQQSSEHYWYTDAVNLVEILNLPTYSTITRENLVTMLYDYLNLLGYQFEFNDAVEWAVETGLLVGVSATDLALTKPVTRIETAVVVQRFIELQLD